MEQTDPTSDPTFLSICLSGLVENRNTSGSLLFRTLTVSILSAEFNLPFLSV